MASKRLPSSPPQKAPTVAPSRATELLNRQIEAARALLAMPLVERLDFEGWEQTTRAVLVGAFGEPSEGVARFEHASPGYPGRIGQDERFWAQYRRDELEAKVTTISSCVTQLELGLSNAAEARPQTVEPPYEAARKVLKVLHQIFQQQGHLSWSISATKDGENHFASVGLDEQAATKALRMLASKRLAKFVGTSSFVITQYGVSACDHPSTLDHELPVTTGSTRTEVRALRAPGADVRELENIAALLESEEVREIVVRDIAELKSALRHGMAKCALLLGGSILEAVLVDVLDRNRTIASSYMKKGRFPEDASLPVLIAIAGDPTLLESPRHLLTPTSVAVAKAVTDHRDLIHPHAEARGRIRVDETTAQAIVHLLSLVVRDLLEATERGDVAAYENK